MARGHAGLLLCHPLVPVQGHRGDVKPQSRTDQRNRAAGVLVHPHPSACKTGTHWGTKLGPTGARVSGDAASQDNTKLACAGDIRGTRLWFGHRSATSELWLRAWSPCPAHGAPEENKEGACTSEHQPQASSEQGEDGGWMLSARGRGRKNSLGLADPWNGKSGPSGSCRLQPCVEPWHRAPRWPCATCPCPRPARIYGEKQKCSQAGRLLPLFS